MHGRPDQLFPSNAAVPKGLASLRLAWRLALRELRGGLRGFYVFLACLALGVAAISGVGSLAQALSGGLAAQGQAILGGDVALSLIHRQASEAERAFLDEMGDVSETAALRGMARTLDGSDQTLVELKAIDKAYPLYGSLQLEPQIDPQTMASAQPSGGQMVWPAAVEAGLLARLDLKIGDQINVGDARFRLAAMIVQEPDRLSSGLTFGPRLLVSRNALSATGLLRPGSLVRWRYALRLPQGARDSADLAAFEAQANKAFPDAAWQIRNRDKAAPRVATAIERFAQILTLVGLTALIVGGVGIANAVRAYMDLKSRTIAILKCIGAPGQVVFLIYLLQIGVLALGGIVVGLACGALLPMLAQAVLAGVLPVRLQGGLHAGPLVLALAYGVLTALAFSLWPLGRARDVAPGSLFRDLVDPVRRWPRWPYLAGAAVSVSLLAGLAILTASEQRIALIYVGAAAASFLLLRLVASAIMALARRAPSLRSPEARLAIGNIHRPGALTPSVVLSLGLGLTLLVALTLIDGNLSRQLSSSIPDQAPSFFFVDVQRDEADRFSALLQKQAGDAKVEMVPMLRGRMVSLGGVAVENIDAPPDKRWALTGDRGITYAAKVPDGSVVVSGDWWPENYQGEPLVSFEVELAQAFGIGIGDQIVVNVLGRQITARIANLRKVDWESLGINFVMVFSPNTFAGAPHMMLTTLTLPEKAGANRELDILRTVSKQFPHVTSVRVKEALDAASAILSDVMWAIRGASSVTIVASILVLAGALAAGHRGRIYDAVVLKVLGATRRRLLLAFSFEYLLLALATGLFAVVAGSAAAYIVLTKVMRADFVFMPWVAAATAAGAALVMIIMGLAATWRLLAQPSARLLRAL